jgi:hypothetical protein
MRRETAEKTSFANRFGRNVIFFGLPWLILSIALDWPTSLTSLLTRGLVHIPGTAFAVLIFTGLEHWYVSSVRDKRGPSGNDT